MLQMCMFTHSCILDAEPLSCPRALDYVTVGALLLICFGCTLHPAACSNTAMPMHVLLFDHTASAVIALAHPNVSIICAAAAVSGVQASLESACLTASYAIGIAVPRAEDFIWLMAGSCCVVTIAAALYTTYSLRWASIGLLHDLSRVL